MTPFFALPDSNTSLRVTICVLGHLVVSQMGIVQVPYATVTVRYVRALMYVCMYVYRSKMLQGLIGFMVVIGWSSLPRGLTMLPTVHIIVD